MTDSPKPTDPDFFRRATTALFTLSAFPQGVEPGDLFMALAELERRVDELERRSPFKPFVPSPHDLFSPPTA
jgi:hypothetical protein